MKRTTSLILTIIVTIQLVTINIYAEDIEIPYDEYIKLLYDINMKEHQEVLDGLGLYTYSGTDIRPYDPSMFDFIDGSVELHAEYIGDAFLTGFASMANELSYLAKKTFKSGDSVVIDVDTYKMLKDKAYGYAVEYINNVTQNEDWYITYYGENGNESVKIPQNGDWYISYYGRDNEGNRLISVEDNSTKTIQIFGIDYKTLQVGKIYDVMSMVSDGVWNYIIEGIEPGYFPMDVKIPTELLLIGENGEIYAQAQQNYANSGFYISNTKGGYFSIYNTYNVNNENKLYDKDNLVTITLSNYKKGISYSQVPKEYYIDFQNGGFTVNLKGKNQYSGEIIHYKLVMGTHYINIADNYDNLVYYTYDEIKDMNLTPCIAVNISSDRLTIKEKIKQNSELNNQIDSITNTQSFTIPISEAEDMIERAIKKAIIDENTKLTLQDGTVVKIDDKQLDEFKKLLEDIQEENNENSGTIIGLLEEILQTLINIKDYMTTGLKFTNPDGTTGTTSFWDFLGTISNGIMNIVNTMTDGLLGIADTLSGGIFDLSGTLADGILEIGNTITSGLLELVNNLVDALINMLVPDEVEFQSKVTELRTEIDNKIPVINQLQSFTSDFTEFLQNESGFTEQEVSQQSIMLDDYNGIQTFTLIEPPEVIIPNEPPTDTYDAPSFSVNLYGSEIKIIDFDMFSKYRNAIHTIIIVLVYLGSSRKIIRKLAKIVE